MASAEDTAPVAIPVDAAKGWLEELAECREQSRKLKEREDRARKQLLALLDADGATVGTIDGEPAVSIRTSTRETLDTKRLRKELGDVALAPYLSTSTTRSLVLPGARP